MTFGIKEKIYLLLLLLPIAVFGLLLYAINYSTEGMTLGGYKRYLEEKINMMLGENVLLWELFMSKERHFPFARNILYVVYALVVGLAIFVSLSTAWQHYQQATFWGAVTAIFFLAIGSIISLWKMGKAFDSAYQIAKKKSELKVVTDTIANLV